MKTLMLFSMLFLHITDDYYLQGKLALFKQKNWWQENCPDEKYKHDWLIALLEHAFSWTFMVMLPIACYMAYTGRTAEQFYITAFLVNMVIHAVTDHLKANKFRINLTVDQSIHIVQVVVTWLIFISVA